MLTDAQIARLNAARFTVREWTGSRGPRWYLRYDGVDIGYITTADLGGSTGSCSNIMRRRGSVAAALRGE